jgi:parallel beta-helix repeat protein
VGGHCSEDEDRFRQIVKAEKYVSKLLFSNLALIKLEKAGKLRRVVPSVIVTLLFSIMFAFALTVQPAKAESGTIYINPDGSINPSTANITTSDNVTYTFTDNNYLPIVVNRSNIIINGRGHTLQAVGGTGFSLLAMSNVTIKNTTITNSEYGIFLDSSSDNVLSGNNVTANGVLGILLDSSSDNNTLSDNDVTANSEGGIDLYYSSGNVLSGNVMASNQWNFGVLGSVWSDFMNNIDTSNLVDGKPVYYLMNQSNIVVSPTTYPEGIGYLGFVNCKNVTVQGLTLTHNNQGLLLAFTNDSKITDNNATANCGDGIGLYSSSGNVLSGNDAIANVWDGIGLYSSDNNTLSDNNAKANIMHGIYLYSSSDNNTLSDNNVTANSRNGIYLYSSSDNNTLSDNNATANFMDGISLYSSSDNNTLSDNDAKANADGIHLYSSSGNVLFDNNATANSGDGIYLDHSSDNNILSGNDAVNNSESGIDLYSSDNNTLPDNNVTANGGDGIYLDSSSGNVFSGNNIIANGMDGIYLSYDSDNNLLSGNDVVNNSGVGILVFVSDSNTIFHNDILGNAQQADVLSSITNIWDDGYPSGGNYWGDYLSRYPSAAENNSSGIWNTSYVIGIYNADRYPLMAPFHTFDVGTWNGTAYSVGVVSNSGITNLSFNQPAKTLSFNVTGTDDTMDFCRVAIPKKLMWCDTSDQWTVTVNGTISSNFTVTTDANYTYIYFTYHHGTELVQIQSTSAIPEFQPSMLTPLFMMTTLLSVMIFDRKRREKRSRRNV